MWPNVSENTLALRVRLLAKIFVLVLATVSNVSGCCSTCDQQGAIDITKTQEGKIGLTDWMGKLDGKLLLSQISIPGSHDSGAHLEPFPGIAACQSLTIEE